MIKARQVVLDHGAGVVLVDGQEEDLVHPDLKVFVIKPATLLILLIQPGKKDIQRNILKPNQTTKGIVRHQIDGLSNHIGVAMAVLIINLHQAQM
jgi:hypothetical protein